MAFHVRDLNKRLTTQAETHALQVAVLADGHAKAMVTLHANWRKESDRRTEKHAELLLHTNRTLDAVLRVKGEDDPEG